MKKALGFVVAALAAVNLGLFGLAAQAQARTVWVDWSCGCEYNAQMELESVCVSWIYPQCPREGDTSNCEPCGPD